MDCVSFFKKCNNVMLAANFACDGVPFVGRLLNVIWAKAPIHGYQQVEMVPGFLNDHLILNSISSKHCKD